MNKRMDAQWANYGESGRATSPPSACVSSVFLKNSPAKQEWLRSQESGHFFPSRLEGCSAEEGRRRSQGSIRLHDAETSLMKEGDDSDRRRRKRQVLAPF